jgi:hypothetical protein
MTRREDNPRIRDTWLIADGLKNGGMRPIRLIDNTIHLNVD